VARHRSALQAVGRSFSCRRRATGASYSSSNGPLSRLISPRLRFLSRRRRLAARLGLVPMRRFGRRAASTRISARRRRAIARLRHCDLVSSTLTVRIPPGARPPRRSMILSRSSSGTEGLAARSHDSSARVDALLACWPPGPPLGSNRHTSSAGGMAKRRPIGRAGSVVTSPVCPRPGTLRPPHRPRPSAAAERLSGNG